MNKPYVYTVSFIISLCLVFLIGIETFDVIELMFIYAQADWWYVMKRDHHPCTHILLAHSRLSTCINAEDICTTTKAVLQSAGLQDSMSMHAVHRHQTTYEATTSNLATGLPLVKA